MTELELFEKYNEATEEIKSCHKVITQLITLCERNGLSVIKYTEGVPRYKKAFRKIKLTQRKSID